MEIPGKKSYNFNMFGGNQHKSGFHIPRTRLAMENVKGFSNAETVYIPAYGPNTTPDNWFLNPVGRSVVFSEIYKLACMKKNQDYKKGISIFSAS